MLTTETLRCSLACSFVTHTHKLNIKLSTASLLRVLFAAATNDDLLFFPVPHK